MIRNLNDSFEILFSPQNEDPRRYLSYELSCAPNEYRIPKLRLGEFDTPNYPKLLAFHLPGLVFCIFFILKMPLEPHFNNHILVNVSSHHISSQR
jgi:hypothetical protein